MRTPIFHSSVYGIITNNMGEILFAKRGHKANGFHDRFQIPAGHIDGKEKVTEALIREMKEELNIDIKEYHLAYTAYRIFEDGREYIDFYFIIDRYNNTIKIGEPDKCSELLYRKMSNLDDINLLQHDRLALKNIENNINFSEIFLKDHEY